MPIRKRDGSDWGWRALHFFLLDATGTPRAPSEAQITQVLDGPHDDARGALSSEALPIKQRDEALRLIARLFGLSEAHQTKLAARGYDLAACGPDSRHLFASLPAEYGTRTAVVGELLARLTWIDEATLRRLPGVSRKGRGAWAYLPQVEGTALLEFRRDELGRIWGVEYAPDVPADPKRKRLWPAGTRVDRVHVARPRQDAGAEIWLAEGGHKAHLLADARAALALASLGKGNWRHFLAALEQLDPTRQRLVVVALDTDAWDESTTEKALVRALHAARWRVALARWDVTASAQTTKGPDDAILAGLTLQVTPQEAPALQGAKPHRVYSAVDHLHAFQRQTETPAARQAHLAQVARQVAERAREHLLSQGADRRSELLVLAAPPGVGKSTATATLAHPNTLGDQLNIAWIAERKDMARSVGWRGRVILPCDSALMCPNWKLHQALAQKGKNAMAAHVDHHETFGRCAYEEQFSADSAALYMVQHVETPHPASHPDGIVIDELNLANWLEARTWRVDQLQAAMPAAVDSYAGLLLRSLQAVIVDAQSQQVSLSGKRLYDALDTATQGRLNEILSALEQDEDVLNTRPWFKRRDDESLEEATERVLNSPNVTLPHVASALIRELIKWRLGGDWNGLVSVVPVAAHRQYGICVTRRRTFTPADHSRPLPPSALLDATADTELLSLLFERPVRVEHAVVAPPPHMRHIAVRIGRRYSKVSLTAEHGKGLERAAREVLYLLRRLDPDGAKRHAGLVGLITYQAVCSQLAERLEIPAARVGNFWGTRGSNAWEDCEILLVVGTPTLPPRELYRMGRALWEDDPEPIIEGCHPVGDGHIQYDDSRILRLSAYLTESELAQCAHRNRPLRHDGRTVVTFCSAEELAYLPATTIVESLPRLTASAEDRVKAQARANGVKLAACVERLRAQKIAINAATLQAESNLRRATVLAWLKAERSRASLHVANSAADMPQTCMDSGLPGLRKKVPISHMESHMERGNLFALIHQPGIHAGSAAIEPVISATSSELSPEPSNGTAGEPPGGGDTQRPADRSLESSGSHSVNAQNIREWPTRYAAGFGGGA